MTDNPTDLYLIAEHLQLNGPMTVQQCAQAFGKKKNAMASQLNKLKKLGHATYTDGLWQCQSLPPMRGRVTKQPPRSEVQVWAVSKIIQL